MEPFAANPWFTSLPEADATALLENSCAMRLGTGETLFARGDPFDGRSGAYFGLVSGRVKLTLADNAGGEVILSIVEPGNWFGAGPTLDRQPRGHSAVAVSPCEIRAVSAANFHALMERNGFAQAIARQMAQRLRLAYQSMAATALLSTRERIMRLLTVLAYGGITLAEDKRNTVDASQETLALMLGISRPTLNKELHTLSKLGLVTVGYGRIYLNASFDGAYSRNPRAE